MSAKKLFYSILILTVISSPVFTASKKLSTLQLKVSFDRTFLTTDYHQKADIYFYFDEINSVIAAEIPAGKDTYQTWTNSQGKFSLLNGKNIFDTDDTNTDWHNDIFNFFTEDLGLSSNGYKKVSCTREDSYVITKWFPQTVTEDEIQIKTVKLYSDNKNKITRAQMYDWDDNLIADTKILKRIYISGEYYPCQIETKLYSEGKEESVNLMTFSEIKINQKIPKMYYPLKTSWTEKTTNSDIPTEKETISRTYASYNTSIPKITVNAAYIFYKKFITEQDISGCAYWPSCSSYMNQAVAKYGPAGIIVGLERLHRCTSTERKRHLYPLSPHGFQLDYVK